MFYVDVPHLSYVGIQLIFSILRRSSPHFWCGPWCGLTTLLQTELFIGARLDFTGQFRVNKSQKMLLFDIRSELRRELSPRQQ